MKKRNLLFLSVVLTFILMLGIGGIAQAFRQVQTYFPIVVNNYPEPIPTPPPPGTDPIPGGWHGSGEDFSLDFIVSNDSKEVTDISGTYYCGLVRVDFWIYTPSTIKNREFNTGLGNPSSGIKIHGIFETSTTVTGTWSGWAYPYSNCGTDWTGKPS